MQIAHANADETGKSSHVCEISICVHCDSKQIEASSDRKRYSHSEQRNGLVHVAWVGTVACTACSELLHAHHVLVLLPLLFYCCVVLLYWTHPHLPSVCRSEDRLSKTPFDRLNQETHAVNGGLILVVDRINAHTLLQLPSDVKQKEEEGAVHEYSAHVLSRGNVIFTNGNTE